MKYFYLVLFSIISVGLFAQEEVQFKMFDEALPQKANRELQFLAFFYNQAVSTNIYPRNAFLKGQVVGRLFGSNTTQTSDSLSANYVEQRILPFFIYTPKLFNGRAILRTSFEIDWTWGDVAYGVGGNQGSSFSADQVNIQTQNVEIELIPKAKWAINLGLQRLYDTPHNPYRTFFNKMLETGYRLSYWGSDAVGLSVRHDEDFYKWKTGYYKLYENDIQDDDDVTLFEATYQYQLGLKWNLGASAYYLRDRSNGEGGPSVLGQGLNSLLNGYNGTYRFPLSSTAYRANVAWFGSYFSFNEDYMMSPIFCSGYINTNFGAVSLDAGEGYQKEIDIAGLGANLRFGYRYGQTTEDAITTDFIFTTGDSDGLSDNKYSGVLTGNTWGTPGALYIGHGGYLIFPHGNVVNRYVALVTDISNLGNGITGGTVNFSKGFIPNKLSAKIGGAWAVSNIASSGGGNMIALEGNAKIAYQFGPFMTLEFHSAYASLGDYYESSLVNGGQSEIPTNPWTAFLGFKWLMF